MTAPKAEVVNVVQDTDLISHRAEIFRSKLIEDFHLLDSISEKGRLEVPKYYSKDVQGIYFFHHFRMEKYSHQCD